jgi:ribosomal protein S18 acetylase RimI-like enzyme
MQNKYAPGGKLAVALKLLPARWATALLAVEDSRQEDVPELQEALDACSYIKPWTGEAEDREESMQSALDGGDLPPNGSKEFFRLQSVRLKETGELVGFLDLYHGYPTADIFWVGLLIIAPKFQKAGYGKELVCGLKETLRKLGGFRVMQLGVALKNWPAIRFWTRVGFDRIVAIKGDEVHSETAFAFMTLECSLTS